MYKSLTMFLAHRGSITICLIHELHRRTETARTNKNEPAKNTWYLRIQRA